MPLRSLSARLLVLTVFFVMLSEVLIFVPSVAHFRMSWFEARIAAGKLATMSLIASPTGHIEQPLTDRLLAQAEARGVTVRTPSGMVRMLDMPMPPHPDATVDITHRDIPRAIRQSISTLFGSGNRLIRVIGRAPHNPDARVEVLLDEKPLRRAMWGFGKHILELSIIISLFTATLVYLSLQWLLVRPMRRITASMIAFRDDPEDASRRIVPRGGRDEIGRAESELAMLQETVRQALGQRARLAALGTAVTKINHDLRNILATAQVVTDGLTASAAPEVRRVAPRLVDAIDRAVALCTRTLAFSREGAPPLTPTRFALRPLIEEIGPGLSLGDDEPAIEIAVPAEFTLVADRDQIYRVLLNLARNAVEAGTRSLRFTGETEPGLAAITVADDGPGLPPRARDNLFRPFFGSARPGGSGLGLAIARELMRAHGGELTLVSSTGAGTVFRLTLPLAAARRPALSRARGSAL